MAEINRITLWVDANCNELGAYYDEAAQRAGKVVWPLIDMDPENPAGLDLFKGGKRPPTPSAETPLMQKSEELIKKLWPEGKRPAPTRRRRGVKPKPMDMSKAVEKFAPGWKLSNCGNIENPGLYAAWAGRKNVLVTHPLDRSTGSVLHRQTTIPAGKRTILHTVVGHHRRGNWTLIARVNKKELARKTVGGSTAVGGWMTVDVDLSAYAGKKVEIELVNQPSGWNWETAYWGEIDLKTSK